MKSNDIPIDSLRKWRSISYSACAVCFLAAIVTSFFVNSNESWLPNSFMVVNPVSIIFIIGIFIPLTFFHYLIFKGYAHLRAVKDHFGEKIRSSSEDASELGLAVFFCFIFTMGLSPDPALHIKLLAWSLIILGLEAVFYDWPQRIKKLFTRSP